MTPGWSLAEREAQGPDGAPSQGGLLVHRDRKKTRTILRAPVPVRAIKSY